ncbi:MAG: hypothetical protein A3K76_04465 [Euryarchaeota archaeon RBG_13_57_23]|nr:MAG: hypothetical protein A3K76_04465 [Euryarchaeota archaeon RBG_13_57_23]
MYARLAKFIVKHYQLVIAVWIVVLFYTFPLIFKINEVVVYSETETGLDNLEAMEAQELIDANFAGEVAPSTIMIVMKSDQSNILGNHVRDFTLDMADAIATDGGMRGVLSVNYMWDSIYQYYAQIGYQTAPALFSLYDQANQSASLLYLTPTSIAYAHWSYIYATGGMLSDDEIRLMVISDIENATLASGADGPTVALTMGYANAFYDFWLPTKPFASNFSELQPIVDAAAISYFAPMGETGLFFVALNQGLGLVAYNGAYAQVGGVWYNENVTLFAIGMVAQQGGLDPTFLHSVWALGPNPSMAEAASMAYQIVFDPSTEFDELPGVPSFLVEPYVNVRPETGPENNTMLMVISLSVNSSSEEAEDDVRVLRTLVLQRTQLLQDPVLGSTTEVFVSGDPALNVDIMDAVEEDTGRIEPATIVLIILLVGLYFRSAVSPWIPLMTVGMAYLLSTAFIYLLGSHVMSIHYSVMTIVLTVMMGAGTDYCIFIMSRYREERVAGRSKEEAMSTSLMWAGESITTSGATVMIGFGALMIASYTLIQSMGMALVVAVGMALLFALTMLPSLLMLIGDKVFWPHTIEQATALHNKKEAAGGGYFRRSARFALSKRKAIVLAALLISVPAVYIFLSVESSYDFIAGLPNAESKKGIDALGAGFGSGKILPTYIVVQYEDEIIVNGSLTPEAAAELETYCQRVDAIDNVRSVSGPTRPFGSPVNESYLENMSQDELATYQLAIENTFGSNNRTIMLTVVLQDQPFTTHSIHTIDLIREASDNNGIFPTGTEVLVGGSTASMSDVSMSVADDFFTMRVIVIIGIFLVLMFVLGSLLIPVRLVMTVLMNVIWTIAVTMIVFQYIDGVPVLWMIPLILFVIAMGLGMDYDIFLTTRIREEVLKGKTDEQAIQTAVERTGGIITACGLVMAGAFGTMMLSSTALLREFGFALSFSILLDAMIIRIYLVPAIMMMLEKWNWYAPGRLQRVRRGEKARKH